MSALLPVSRQELSSSARHRWEFLANSEVRILHYFSVELLQSVPLPARPRVLAHAAESADVFVVNNPSLSARALYQTGRAFPVVPTLALSAEGKGRGTPGWQIWEA